MISPITRTRSPSCGSRNASAAGAATRTLSRTHSGAGHGVEGRGDAVSRDDAPVLEHECRPERAEVVEQDAVGPIARRDRSHPRQTVTQRRVQRREQQRVLGRDALRDRHAAHLVDVALRAGGSRARGRRCRTRTARARTRARAAADRAGCGRSRPRAAAPTRRAAVSRAPRSRTVASWSLLMPVAR